MNRRSVVFLLLAASVLTGAKEYWYPSIETEVRLLPNDNARIEQTRTYQFDGSFSWAFVELEKRGADDGVFDGLYEADGGGWKRIEPLELSDRSDALYLKWGYSAQDEEKAFLLRYTVVGAVTRWRDVAEFHWKVVEDEHEAVQVASVSIILPDSAPDLFKVYVHSRARPGELEFTDERDAAYASQTRLPRNAFQEVRVLVDPALFPGAKLRDEPAYSRILGEEKRNFIMSALKVYLLMPLAILFLLVLPLILLLSYYFRYGREPETTYDAVYEHEPPTDAPPQVVPAILHQKPDATVQHQEMFRGLFAGLLGLAGKGFVSVQEIDKKGYRFTLEKPGEIDQLDPFDRAAVDLLFGKVAAGGRSFTDKEFREYGKQHSVAVRTMLGAWFLSGRAWWRERLGGELIDRVSTRAYGRFTLLVLASLAIGAVGAGIAVSGVLDSGTGPLPWFLAGVAGFVMAIVFLAAGKSIHRWSKPAYEEHLRWQRFSKFLRESSAIEEAPIQLLPIWEHYYVYAVALGVAEEFLKNVGKLAAARGESLATPVWFAGHRFAAGSTAGGPAGFQSAMKSLSSFGSNFAGMAGSFSPRSSSGGGFSGGGGGGGGGGSSGAG